MGAEPTAGEGRARRRWLREREWRLGDLGKRQHGVVARRQLLALGFSARSVGRRLEAGRLRSIHRGVYAVGHDRLAPRGYLMAGVLACDKGAVLSHKSAARLWGLMRSALLPVEVTATRGRGRSGLAVHEGGLTKVDYTTVAGIPVTTVARTLLDLADVIDEERLERAFEEADRLRLLEMRAVEDVCARGRGRRGLKPLRRLMAEAREPEESRTPLEARLLALCREHGLPRPETNVTVLDREVDAFWPAQKVMVEADSWAFHRHRAAFEDDRARDARMHAEGYRVIRLTFRRLTDEPAQAAAQLRRLLSQHPPAVSSTPNGCSTNGGSSEGQEGQGTVEWVGLLAVVALVAVALGVAVGRVPGAELARAVGSKLLCAAALAERCGDEPVLIAAYGEEVGRLAREYMPSLAYERGARALPVDFRRCRSSTCGDGPLRGLVDQTDTGLPVTAFVHVIDCRAEAGREEEGAASAVDHPVPDCSGERAGSLYLQYWLYYVDSATMRGVPVAGRAGYHRDDWESVQVRIGADGQVDERASSHHGYNHDVVAANAASDAGLAGMSALAERIGARPRNGWGARRGLLLVSGGSHAGNVGGPLEFDRVVLAPQVHLVPLEAVAAEAGAYRFVVAPPWRKRVWLDPEAEGTD
jgi:very-short-patch-repair endonuclease